MHLLMKEIHYERILSVYICSVIVFSGELLALNLFVILILKNDDDDLLMLGASTQCIAFLALCHSFFGATTIFLLALQIGR